MWISSFLRSMWSLCFAHLSTLRRSVSALSLRLVSCAYTLIRLVRPCLLSCLFLLILLLVSGTNKVLAQDPSETPTPTDVSIWSVPTQGPTVDLGCNNGSNPVGFGTGTPDPYWLSKCQGCITRTPLYNWPTNTPDPRTPTVTATPIPTATQVPNSLYECTGATAGTCEILPGNVIKYHFTGSNVHGSGSSYRIWLGYGGFKRPQGTDLHFYYIGTVRARNTHPTSAQGVGMDAKVDGVSNRLTVAIGNVIGIGADTTFTLREHYYPLSYLNDVSSTTFLAGIYTRYIQGNATLADYVLYDFDYYIYVSPVELDINTLGYQPTPTPTPITGYCRVAQTQVPNTIDNTMFNNPYFALPNIRYGWSRCMYVGLHIPDWATQIYLDNGASQEEIDRYNQNSFQLCVKPIKFGNIAILGLVINLDLISYVMAGVLLFRMIFRR